MCVKSHAAPSHNKELGLQGALGFTPGHITSHPPMCHENKKV